jgi:hypothetical protein
VVNALNYEPTYDITSAVQFENACFRQTRVHRCFVAIEPQEVMHKAIYFVFTRLTAT